MKRNITLVGIAMYGRTSKQSTFEVIVRNVPEHNAQRRIVKFFYIHNSLPFYVTARYKAHKEFKGLRVSMKTLGTITIVRPDEEQQKKISLANEFERESLMVHSAVVLST